MLKIILFLFHLLIMTLPFVFTAINEELFEFNKMLLIYGSTVVIGFFWCLALFRQEIKLVKTKLQLFLLVFIFSQILSSIFSIHPRTSILGYYTRLNGGLLSTISYSLLFLFFTSSIFSLLTKQNAKKVKSYKKKLITSFIQTSVISGTLVSLYAIPEHFGHSLSCLLITKQFDVACWVQDVQNRVFASFGQPNWLAAYLIMLIPLAIHLALQELKQLNKKVSEQSYLKLGLYSLSSALMFTALIFTKSRSGLLGLAIGLVIYYGLKFLNKKLSLSSLIFPIIFIIISLIFGTVYTPSIKELLSSPSTEELIALDEKNPLQKSEGIENNPLIPSAGGTDSGDIRKIVWQGALKVWQRYPIFGSGVETFGYSYYQDRPLAHNLVSEWDFLYNKAHNEFLNLLATSGIFGLTTYLLLLIVSVYLAIKYSKQFPSLAAIIASLAALAVSNFFGFATVAVSFLMFLLIALIDIATKKTIKNKALPQKLQAVFKAIPLEIPLILLVIISFSLLNKITKIWRADLAYTQGKQLARAGDYAQGTQKLQTAIELVPREALFYDELANTYAKIAVQLALAGETEQSEQYKQAALETTDLTLSLNPRHLNFHKTKIRTLITLSQLDDQYLEQAKAAVETAIKLAPTDAKLVYNLGLIEYSLGDVPASKQTLQTAIEMKPNYHDAIFQLAKIYELEGNLSAALKQYQRLNQLVKDETIKAKLEQLEATVSAQTD